MDAGLYGPGLADDSRSWFLLLRFITAQKCAFHDIHQHGHHRCGVFPGSILFYFFASKAIKLLNFRFIECSSGSFGATP